MECERCGGLVTWRGPLTNLTHTECENCGGINCQVPDNQNWSDDTDELVGNGNCGERYAGN